MATELSFPLYSGFFPNMVLTIEQLMHYRRLSADRVGQMTRIIEDADCIYRWTDLKARNGRTVHKAQFLDIRPDTKQPTSEHPSTLFKCSVHIVDVPPEEILQAIAKLKTRDARRTMSYMHGHEFLVDTQTLLTFPKSTEQSKPSYAYRAIKWSFLKAKRREGKSLDFCYLEYAGKKKLQDTASSVMGFCIQESIAKEHQVPTLERFGILRGQLVRSGIVITKTHQSNILKVTSMAQIDGAIGSSEVRNTMEGMMVDFVAAVYRVKGLLERQRMGRLQYLDEWDWVSTKERKACAVCLRGFYFRRKHHCATCGEVVCSSCAPLRELDEPLNEQIYSMRVCSLCMAQAGSHRDSSLMSESEVVETTTMTTTNMGTETYLRSLRYPKPSAMHREGSEEEKKPEAATPATRNRLASHRSAKENETAGFESMRREPRTSGVVPHSTLSSSSLPAQAKKETLDKLVEQVRRIRDTINLAILEAENERLDIERESGLKDPDAGTERIDERIMKIRDTLDISSSEFDAVLQGMALTDLSRSFDAESEDRAHSDGGSSYGEGMRSEENSVVESLGFPSPRSSLLSTSTQSLDHQDAGEPLPPATREEEETSDDDEARALEEAMEWVRQAEPTANLASCRPVSPIAGPATPKPSSTSVPTLATASTRASAANTSKTRGIERLAQKIGRLHQRLEATQREAKGTGRAAASSTNPREDECEPEKDPSVMPRRSASTSAVDPPRGTALQEKQATVTTTARDTHNARSSGPARAPPDLVASLRGVMNSSELTHVPPRRHSGAISPKPSPSLQEAPLKSYPKTSRRAPPPPPPGAPPALPPVSSFQSTARASAAPIPVQGTTIYVFDPEDQVQKVQRRSLDRRSVSATKARDRGFEKEAPMSDAAGKDRALSSLDEEHEEQSARASSRRPSARDESGELRELMEGLAKAPLRSRCWSGQSTGAPPSEKFDF